MRFDRGGQQRLIHVKCFKSVNNLQELTAELKMLKKRRRRI
jgi:hypothetical protein